MFEQTTLDLSKAGSAGALVLDYLAGKKHLAEFYSHPPTQEGFSTLLNKKPYTGFQRKILVETLLQQASSVENTSAQSIAAIKLLSQDNTYTLTTGHQLCLFTGPLYFLYKIATTINLARRLSEQHKNHRFVPVFWLASEDHDFEEVNHFHTAAETIRWKSEQQGAVGRFRTGELKTLWSSIQSVFGNSEHGLALSELFRQAYLEHSTLRDATRFLVNALFGEEGIVIIDADHPAFKSQFREEMKKDLFDGLTFREVEKTAAALSKHQYNIQVKPREVNLFLLGEQQRMRIDRLEDGTFAAGALKFSRAQLESLIEKEPEKFSPNVSLRGLYQQKILPNIAYIGGPGELSYWLEYKIMFEAYGIQFPVLVPRNSFTILDEGDTIKLKRLGIKTEDLFRPLHEVTEAYMLANGKVTNAEAEKSELKKVYSDLRKKVSTIDNGLLKYSDALEHRHLEHIDNLVKKLNRSMRRQSETGIKRIGRAQQIVKPAGIPQERHYNFSVYFLMYGEEFIKCILAHSDPFLHQHIILRKQS